MAIFRHSCSYTHKLPLLTIFHASDHIVFGFHHHSIKVGGWTTPPKRILSSLRISECPATLDLVPPEIMKTVCSSVRRKQHIIAFWHPLPFSDSDLFVVRILFCEVQISKSGKDGWDSSWPFHLTSRYRTTTNLIRGTDT